jgi:D-alanine-D-alanine ligase
MQRRHRVLILLPNLGTHRFFGGGFFNCLRILCYTFDMNSTADTVVGVLRGGPSNEHEVSLKSGHAVVANLPRDTYTVRDIYIDKQGLWNERGRVVEPADVLRSTDVMVNALHGEYGEDGKVQRMLELFNVPYTGSDSLSSFFTMHKVMAKERAKEMGIKTPKYHFVERGANIENIAVEITRTFHQPVVVKPVQGGSSVGVSIVGGYAQVYGALSRLLAEVEGAMVEEYIRGTEATVGVIENFRDEAIYALPPIEIIPPANDFFSYDAKYTGKSKEICPARFSRQVMDELTESARTMHTALSLRHYSRSDYIVSSRGIYYIETNTLPGLTKESLFPKSLAAVGIAMPAFLTHIVGLALGN